MADPMTEPLDPYEPDPSAGYDWEDESAADKPRILWGRVAVLGGMLVLAFLLGRATKGGGIPAEQLTEARQEIQTLEKENAALEDELASAPDVTDTDTGTETEDSPTEGTETEDTGTSVEGKTYVVEEGDSLTTIAVKFYDDPSLDNYLAEVNGITDPTQLAVGQELLIPDDPPS